MNTEESSALKCRLETYYGATIYSPAAVCMDFAAPIFFRFIE